jgi:uncharacterized protein (UPF0305 family)
MPLQINIYYECDKCHDVEEIKIFNAEFYNDYMLHPEGVDFEQTKIKWHDNVLYPAKGKREDGDYELLCDKCYQELDK